MKKTITVYLESLRSIETERNRQSKFKQKSENHFKNRRGPCRIFIANFLVCS